MRLQRLRRLGLGIICAVAAVAPAVPLAAELDPADAGHLMDLSLAELAEIKVRTSSLIPASLRHSPAAMIVVTQAEIRQRGYTDLAELLLDLPGFDHTVTNGDTYIVSWQRGYRTPSFQRTLILVNGIQNNHLWSNEALISRQFPMTHIERVEVLYGPAGAVHGPNAFLGVINIITSETRADDPDVPAVVVQSAHGSHGTGLVDASLAADLGPVAANVGLRWFASDEPGLGDYPEWGFATRERLDDRAAWGAVLDEGHGGISYGDYADRSTDRGLSGLLRWKGLELGVNHAYSDEGYGLQYAFDRVQPNQSWRKRQDLAYLRIREDAGENVALQTQLSVRTSRTWGGWVEAVPDWAPGRADSSYLSISDWNSSSSGWKLQQTAQWRLGDDVTLAGGAHFERKALNKAYDVCSYWQGSVCLGHDESDLGPYGLGHGIFHSRDPAALRGAGALDHAPASNREITRDIGAFVEGTWNPGDLYAYVSARIDDNSRFGTFIKPRLAVAYDTGEKTTVKLIYGEAYQEPAARQLYGSWSGRQANPDMRPEEVRNYEAVLIHRQEHWWHDLSLFRAEYTNMIREDAVNSGELEVMGAEYRGRIEIANPLAAAPVQAYLYYTFAESRSSESYDFASGLWVEREAAQGDIAPHKVQAGVNLPLPRGLNLNVRANWTAERDLFLRNPLRGQGRRLPAATVVDLHLFHRRAGTTLGLKVRNVFDKGYFHPGAGQASSGDTFTDGAGVPLRSQGFPNSLVPQPGRSVLLSLTTEF